MGENQIKRYEIYTVSGKRLFVDGHHTRTDAGCGDLTIYDEHEVVIAQFRLENIEGWLIQRGE